MKSWDKRLISILASAVMALTALTSVGAVRAATDVNIAVGKPITSKVHGDEEIFGSRVTNSNDGNAETNFTPCPGTGGTERVTIDLKKQYPVTEVCITTWGNETDPEWGLGSSTFAVIATNEKIGSDGIPANGIALTRRMNGESGYFKNPAGGYNSYFELPADVSQNYRYIQFVYTKAADAVADIRLCEFEVYTTQAAAVTDVEVISRGKPVYTPFGGTTFGNDVNKANDGNYSTEFWAYGTEAGGAPVTICLENKYPIEKVTVDMKCGGVQEVWVSNDRNFEGDLEILEYSAEEDGYILPENATQREFMFVQVFNTVDKAGIAAGNDDATPTSVYKEIEVYSLKSYADQALKTGDRQQVSVGKAITSLVHGEYGYDVYYATKANDGDTNTDSRYIGISDQGQPDYLQIDLGCTYPIYCVEVLTNGGGDWRPDAASVWLSNDPNFSAGNYVALADFKGYGQNAKQFYPGVSTDSIPEYKYVRVNKDEAFNSDAWEVIEVTAYSDKAAAAYENIALAKPVSKLEGDGWVADGWDTALNDGNRNTEGGALTGRGVITLPYASRIDRIEIDMRPGSDDESDRRGFNVWLSNTPDLTNAVQVSTASETAVYPKESTIFIPVASRDKYKYIIFGGLRDGIFVFGDIRAMSTDIVKGLDMGLLFSGEELKPETTVTLTGNYRADVSQNMDVKMIVAQYDGNKLVNVEMADDTVIGTEGVIAMPYTLGTDVGASVSLKGYLWQANDAGALSLTPVCNSAVR